MKNLPFSQRLKSKLKIVPGDNLYEEETKFIEEYENKVAELTKNANLAFFNASISGKPEDYKIASDLQIELNKIYSNNDAFKELQKFKNGEIDDPLIKRQIDLIYNEYAANQFDTDLQKEIIELSTSIEERYSTFRASLYGRDLTDNELDEILKTSESETELKAAWEASKIIGEQVHEDIIKLVKLRNKAATQTGYENYHQMSLILSEQNPADMDNLFDELNELTLKTFSELKDEIDNYLSEKYNVSIDNLKPWHYQDKYFQQGPKIYNVDYNRYYKDENTVELTRKYFNSINLEVDSILENSDLFEKENKYQHAYCTDIDRNGDIRIVCNIKHNQQWMGTMLHEMGHAVYDKYISPKLPWQLRSHSHILTTESIAMLFGRFSTNPYWIDSMLHIGEDEVNRIKDESFKSLRLEQLVFSRWTQVIYRFEKEMYSNPDADLNSYWWDLVERFQLIKKPSGRNRPDWAAKIHIALYPAYYHNYMLGELLASQLQFYITKKVLQLEDVYKETFSGQKEVGEYLQHLFFSPGAVYDWNELVVKSTGELLSPKYYAEQFIYSEELI